MWTLILLALLPTSLLIADVEPVAPVVGDTPVTVYEAPKAAQTTHPTAAKMVELHLKPSTSSPVVANASESELSANAQDTGIVADNMKWMSVERPVMMTGFVDKSAIDKNLDVARGTLVWKNEEKTVQLTTVDDPSAVRLLDVDRMGRVEVKEPRVLYYGMPLSVETTPAPAISDAPANWSPESQPRRSDAVAVSDNGRRSIEGTLKKANPLFSKKLVLVDGQGQHICRIDPNSPINSLTFEQYLGRTAVFVGDLRENNGELTLTVRSIRLR